MVQSNFTFRRSYVRTEEYDLTQTIDSNSGTIGSITGEFRRGPNRPTYVAPQAFYNKYGERSDPSLSYAWDTAQCFSAASQNMLLNRVTNEAKFAGLDSVIDDDATYGQRLLMLPFVTGADLGYDPSGKLNTSGVSLLKLTAALASGDVFDMDITDGQTVINVNVVFNSSQNDTMAAIALAINDAIQTFSPNLQGGAIVYNETVSPLAPRYTIILRKPNDASIEFLTPTVTDGSSADRPIISLIDAADCWLCTTFAENSGIWAQQYGAKITGIDQGIRPRYRLTFSGPFVTSNVINMQINGDDIVPVPFNVNSDQTLAALATAIQAHPDVLSVQVDAIVGAINNDRSMTVIANSPGPDTLVMTQPIVTGGTAQPIGVITNILKGQPSSGILNYGVFNTASVNSAVENYEISLFKQTNGRGEQVFYDNIVNQGTGSSINVRVVGNPEFATDVGFARILPFLLDSNTVYRQTVAWLNGGDDGFSVTSGQLITALKPLTDRIRYPINLFMSAGYTDTLYMQALTNLCETRGDSTAILDMPVSKQRAQDAYDFRMQTLNIDSSYAAIYTPNVQITDVSTGEDRYIPPSGPVGAAYVYNDNVRNRYAAPAGLNRGVLKQVRGLLYEYTPEELEMLNPVGINAIVTKRATGPTIMSEETLQYKQSALSSIHIRRTLNDVKTTLADGLEYTLFEPNTESTRFNVIQLAESVLAPAKRNEGLYDYLIKCDESNNSPDVIDRDVLVVDIYVKPVRVAKGIILRSFITRTGISFTEIVAQFTL